MFFKSNLCLRMTTILLSSLLLVACATPATKAKHLSDAEIKQERSVQRELAQKATPQARKRKHHDLAVYEKRLAKIAAPLELAAKKINNKSKKYKYKILDKDGLIAYTDGVNVVFTPEMMDFLDKDQDLAVVVAHELSHNIMGHHSKKTQNAIIGTVVDIAAAYKGFNTNGLFGSIGAMSYSQGFENEADYVGIYIMANAGYEITNVHEIWRRLTTQTGSGTKASFFSSHPSNPERYLRMKKTIEEVLAKKKAGVALMPNFA